MQVRLLAYQVFLSLPRIYLSCFYVRMQEKKYCLNSFKELEEEEKAKMKDPELPEPKMPFDDWKNFVCSEKDSEKKAEFILKNWEEEAYSFW